VPTAAGFCGWGGVVGGWVGWGVGVGGGWGWGRGVWGQPRRGDPNGQNGGKSMGIRSVYPGEDHKPTTKIRESARMAGRGITGGKWF